MDAAITHSAEPYGREFAVLIAQALKAGKSVYYRHRDYCGMGLIFSDSKFQFVYVYDGVDFDPISAAVFAIEEDFIQFLAQQSDFSLSGLDPSSMFFEDSDFNKNNQRLNKARLQSIL